ncbi:MAG: alcohol dehydrogenase [Cenarchaeum symbiont of Oopsacas minuta]|nr:alcohol dehydrogenase [Cenarchaeum symbiont of Oopsacas minuta]
MKFAKKKVLITGASEGIGLASAQRFATKGADIVLVARDMEKLIVAEQSISKMNVQTAVIKCDVADAKQVQDMAKQVQEFGGVDILINNAGFAIYDTVSDQSVEQIKSQILVNYMGMVHCTKAFLPSMLEHGYGRIINIASVGASIGVPSLAPYCASKFAILGFSESLRYELQKTGVDVTVISPIMTRTNFFTHSSFGKMGERTTVSVSAQMVAKAIEMGITSKKLEITVPKFARCAIWAKQMFPYFVMPYIGRIFNKQFERVKKER